MNDMLQTYPKLTIAVFALWFGFGWQFGHAEEKSLASGAISEKKESGAHGVLRIHPKNPRYFTDDRGKGIYLTGSHTWYLIQKNVTEKQSDNSVKRWEEYLDFMQGHGHNFTRIWVNFSYLTDGMEPFPWKRTGPGKAFYGQPKFDMKQFDQAYFDMVKDRVQRVQDRGMYCSVMLFGSGNGIRTKWIRNAWNPNNNINVELADAFNTSNHKTFYTTNSAALDVQRGLVRKTIDTLRDMDNLIWEIINEGGSAREDISANRNWQYGMIKYARGYEREQGYKRHLVGMTSYGGNVPNSEFFDSPADWISPSIGGFMKSGGSPDYKGKTVISDTDHFWGFSRPSAAEDMQKWVWKTFTRGNHPIFMDSYDTYFPAYENDGSINDAFDDMRDAMGHTLKYAKRFTDIAQAEPSSSKSDTKYGLFDATHGQYLAYNPSENSSTMTIKELPAGKYTVEYWDAKNFKSAIETFNQDNAGDKRFTRPASITGDWVVFIGKSEKEANLPESSSPIYSRDFETDDAGSVISRPGIAVGKWGDAFGHGPSGGWRFQPDPIVDPTTGTSEHAAGWGGGLQGGSEFPVDAHHLITVSYMYKVSQTLVQEIARGGPFWAHDQKAIDFKYHDPDAPYGEGHRNTIHFGESNGKVRFCHVDGGGGTRIYFGPDWLTLADEWVWLCHVIDMRGATPAERYVATYMKRKGDTAVTRIGIRYEDGTPKLQAYDGRGIWGFLSPFHGYWDDMVDRNGLANDLAQMSLSLDRLRVMPGWPDAPNGPPF